jgi:hypothetical protein
MTKTVIFILSLTLAPLSVFASDMSDNAKSACAELGMVSACGVKTSEYESKLIDYINRISVNGMEASIHKTYCGSAMNGARNAMLTEFEAGGRNKKVVCKDPKSRIKKLITNL